MLLPNAPLIGSLTVLASILWACTPEKSGNDDALRTIQSQAPIISYVIEGIVYPNWTIVPEASPDRLMVECTSEKSTVSFLTGIDSISFEVGVGDTFQFYVLLNQQDSALTEIVGVEKNVHFTDEYIRQHQGKFAVEIPEVHELANIMVAISKIGQQDSNLIDMTSAYYKEVMEHFGPYQNHPAIDTINNHITGVFHMPSYSYYYALKMNACGYVFDKKGQIVDDGIIHDLGFGDVKNPFETHTALFNDFAGKTDFRTFYRSHISYYQTLTENYRQLNPIVKMQDWLELKFHYKYGNYRITFSPLVGGAHSTQRFADNSFEQTIMFVCRAEAREKYSPEVNEMIQSKVVFTEIDHNFVNPLSDGMVPQIEAAMSDRTKWVQEGPGTDAYDTPYAVFNEYMTWSLFSLYCRDHFPEAEVATFIPMMEKQMTTKRGFIQFDRFNQELLQLYQGNKEMEMDTLYAQIMNWCGNQ